MRECEIRRTVTSCVLAITGHVILKGWTPSSHEAASAESTPEAARLRSRAHSMRIVPRVAFHGDELLVLFVRSPARSLARSFVRSFVRERERYAP